MHPKTIKVMLCDDSATMRRLVRRAIESDSRIEVAAEARNGAEAVEQWGSVKPDVLVLDVEMPVMDGIDTVRMIRKADQRTPIVMFSSLTNSGAEATLDALGAGANDFLAKPAIQGHVRDALEQVQSELTEKILLLTCPKSADSFAASQCYGGGQRSMKLDLSTRIDVVAVGVSTGGPEALARMLLNVPPSFSKPIVITQHMPPMFTAILAQRLSQQTGHCVEEAKDGEVLEPSKILVAPGDYHVVFQRHHSKVMTRLNQDEPENSCRPAIDPLFRSMAGCFGRRSLGVVLTGMGKDGLEGAKALKMAGSSVVVQDQDSSVVWGMPREVFKAGCANAVMTPEEIGATIASLDAGNNLNQRTPQMAGG